MIFRKINTIFAEVCEIEISKEELYEFKSTGKYCIEFEDMSFFANEIQSYIVNKKWNWRKFRKVTTLRVEFSIDKVNKYALIKYGKNGMRRINKDIAIVRKAMKMQNYIELGLQDPFEGLLR
jgi:tRNA splicing ligase